MKAYEIATDVKPTERQLKWQDAEFYAIIYYGMNTFTAREIGDGFAVPEMFYPENIDTDEWAAAVKDLNMKGFVLTAKHYDGFCNWQTNTTDYCVKNSNWLDGEGDLVKMAAESARKKGLEFGIYFPVWDRHEKSFNKPEYNTYLQEQIKELVTSYGKLFTFYLDDRCDDIIDIDIDYKAIYSIIREHQPDCAITFRGPDGRWLGNSRGVTRECEWSCVPASYTYDEDGSVPYSKKLKKNGVMEIDIGSRKSIRKETVFRWAPCEVIIPMRKSWFYKKDEDYSSKTKDKLLDLYIRTVGNNANLMLGLAPDKRGKFTDTESQIFKSTGHDLRVIFGYNLLAEAIISASSQLSELYKASNTSKDDNTFWTAASKDKKPEIIINFEKTEMFDKVYIMENICNGQSVEEFTVYIDVKGKWKKFAQGKTIGHKKICYGKPVESDKIKIVFKKYRKTPEIRYILAN